MSRRPRQSFPVPKTSARAFVGIYRMATYEVILAIGLGKLLKYALYAYVVSRFPRYRVRVYAAAMPSMGPTVVEAGVAEERVLSESVRKVESHRWWRPTQQ